MRVLYTVLCEDAKPRDDGRVDLSGVFHHLFAPGFPAQQERMTLVVNLEWEPAETGKVDFRIDLLDPAGAPTGSITGQTEVGIPGPHQPPQRTSLVVELSGVVFPTEGVYEFELHARGERVRLAPLHLIEHPEAR